MAKANPQPSGPKPKGMVAVRHAGKGKKLADQAAAAGVGRSGVKKHKGKPPKQGIRKDGTAYPICTATKKDGTPCSINANGEPGFCFAHSSTEFKHARGFQTVENSRKGARASKVKKPTQAINELVNSNVLAFFKPHLRSLGLEGFEEDDGTLAVREVTGSGAKLYSTSEGTVFVSPHDDLEAMQKAAERLFDRGYGKSVQTNLLGQSDSHGPVEIDVPTTAERLAEVAEVLKELEGL